MKQLLHVGPGYNTKKDIIKFFNNDDWQETRVDINKDVNPDILGGMQDLSNVKKEYYDAIYSSHSIEHVYQYEVNGVLREFYKVLNDDGVAVITCPELKSVCKLILEDKLLDTAYVSKAGPITPIDILFGHRDSLKKGNEFMAHKNGFTLKTLTKECHLAGFKSVAGIERLSYFDIWIVAQKNEVNKQEFTAKIKKILEF